MSIRKKPTPVRQHRFPSPGWQADNGGLALKNIKIGNRRTSIRLEPLMWAGLADVACREKLDIHQLCTFVAATKHGDLAFTTALRVFLFSYFRSAATEHGHMMAGHGQLFLRFAALRSGAQPSARCAKKPVRPF
jgi:predicted DNA-binding ribbon-helix-helix protein